MEEPSEIENWQRISILGSGAFGIVSLWKKQNVDEYIAIKKCKFHCSGHINAKQKSRWENEVNIMKKLNQMNIVSYKPLPKVLETALAKYNPTKLPLLSMEYCRKGNLRHVLNQAKNSSGLQENEVRIILQDITKAVAYLHDYRITHRDIKPENIVLQQCDTRPGGIIYKLIDLGYAKELNDSIVSFVGTLHYLAPEIFRTENYNHSVDYWSLGIVTFEIICGILPFLPQFTPIERFPYIEKKKPEHICIYQLHSGSVAHSSELLKENHLSSCLKQSIEIWLRHVLQFDANLRTTIMPNINTNVFNFLLKILDKKIINVLSVYTLEFHSYEINEATLVGTLKDWIMRDTKVEKKDQVLVTNSQIFDVTDEKYIVDTLNDGDLNVYVFKKGSFINSDKFTLPKYVQILFQNCTQQYKWRELRTIYTKTLFFLMQENKFISATIKAFNLYTCYVCSLNVKLKTQLQLINKNLQNLMIKVECYCNIHTNNNISKFIVGRGDDYKQCLLNYKQLINSLEKSIITTNKLIAKVGLLNDRQTILDKLLPKVQPILNNCNLKISITKAADLLTKGSPSNDGQLSSKDMVKVVSDALKEKDKLFNNKNFRNYAKATSVAVKDLETMLEWMSDFQTYIAQLATSIEKNQNDKYQILLSSMSKPTHFYYKDQSVQLNADNIVSENLEIRYKFEETLGQAFLEHKKFCDEINEFLSQNM